MNRFILGIVGLAIVFIWLTISENMEDEEKRKGKLNYYESLPKGVKTIIDRIKWDSLSYETSVANKSIENDFLIVFKNDEETKLWKDFVKDSDSLSTTDTSRLKTIVLIQPVETKVGTYQNGAEAIRNDYKVSFIKYPEFILYYQSNLEGSDPPSSINRRAGDKFRGAGPPPDRNKVIEFVLSSRISI
jgi:hypothetical protein